MNDSYIHYLEAILFVVEEMLKNMMRYTIKDFSPYLHELITKLMAIGK
jgi:hypothetical protein